MKPGEKDEAVAIVQQALVDLGFVMPIITGNGQMLADEIYGPETTSVDRKFQTTFGLAVDGVVGRQTLHKLDELITTFIAGRRPSLRRTCPPHRDEGLPAQDPAPRLRGAWGTALDPAPELWG
jgi:peptidoglycan hydrolase-like protein with peptidoglycan-binding domain